MTLSTKILLDFVKDLKLQNKTFLELGCGCGIISIYASKKGAAVTATDINTTALHYLKKMTINNNVLVTITESNLFENLQDKSFDYIIVNPPYYPKTPNSIKESAWFCGQNFEYFERLFYQIRNYVTKHNKVYMILSQDCNLERIKAIALNNGISFQLVLEKKVLAEKNYIFQMRILNHIL